MFNFFRHRNVTRSSRNPRMERLAARINELATRDREMKIFGASTFGAGHHYRLNPVLPVEELKAFEREYDVRLPDDYADFLTQIGNGGVGPNYGLSSLEESVSRDPGHRCRDFLSSPFPLSEFFDPASDESDDANEFLCEWYLHGSIVLSHHGCGYFDLLVITGPQAGQVWFDGSVSDQGIAPRGCDFYTWYDQWLTDSLYRL